MVTASIAAEFRRYKALAESAIGQLDDAQLSTEAPGGGNSIAVICWHVSGNLRSRFTDFLTSDGEKPWRHRDEEFVTRRVTRAELLEKWEQGWSVLLATLAGLDDGQLDRTVTIRGEPMPAIDALQRALAHTASHAGQIVFFAKALRGSAWTSLSIPLGKSEEFNRKSAGSVAGPPAVHSPQVRAFRALHRAGLFVMPNPWDAGSARLLEQMGFSAVATTSSGFAWTQGRPDNGITLAAALEHLRRVAASVTIPVNADFEGGFAVDPDGVAANVHQAVRTGIAGLSIEDSSGDPAHPLFDFALAVARIRAARQAIDESGTGVLLTGRSEGYLVGRPDLAETIRRLVAFAEAGADCLFAPRMGSVDDIRRLVQAVAPAPVNVLVGSGFTTAAELAGIGVRRISVGGGLARVAWAGFLEAAGDISSTGVFTSLERGMPFDDLNGRFKS